MLDHTLDQTWPRYYYDQTVYQILFNKCVLCKENERKLLVDWLTEWQTGEKQHALPSSKGA